MTTPALTRVVVSYGGVADAVTLVASLGDDVTLDTIVCATKPGDAAQARAAFAGIPASACSTSRTTSATSRAASGPPHLDPAVPRWSSPPETWWRTRMRGRPR